MTSAAQKSTDKSSATQARKPTAQHGTRRPNGTTEALLALHGSVGNRAVTDLLRGSSGKPLDSATRREMEAKFGAALGDVKVHTDEAAASAALGAGARALTYGRDIAFAEGFYAPSRLEGKRLIAHELAHVIQQSRPHGRSVSALAAESEARAAGANAMTAGGAGATFAVQASVSTMTQADGLTKDEIKDLIAQNEARAEGSKDKEESDRLYAERNQLLDQLKLAAEESPAAAPPPAPPAATTPPPAPSPEEQEKARDEETLKKAGVTAEQVRDYAALPHGDVMDKYGFFNYWKIRSAARGLPGDVLVRTLPPRDKTVYWQASGRAATNEDERKYQLGKKIEEFQVPSALGSVLMTGGYAAGAKPETIKALQGLGDNLGDLAMSAAAVGQGRAANREVTESVENRAPEARVTQEPVKADEVANEPLPDEDTSSPHLQINESQQDPANPNAAADIAARFLGLPEDSPGPANDVHPPNEPQSNWVELPQEPAANDNWVEVRPEDQQLPMAAGQDFGDSQSDPTVASAGGGKKGTNPPDAPSLPPPSPVPDPALTLPAPNGALQLQQLKLPGRRQSTPANDRRLAYKFELLEDSAARESKAEHGADVLNLGSGAGANRSFPGVDLISKEEFTQVKAYTGPGAGKRVLEELSDLSGSKDFNIPGSKAWKAMEKIEALRAQMAQSGETLELPKEYDANRLRYIRQDTVFRVADDLVESTRADLAGELQTPHGAAKYGLSKQLSAEEAETYAARRIKPGGMREADLK